MNVRETLFANLFVKCFFQETMADGVRDGEQMDEPVFQRIALEHLKFETMINEIINRLRRHAKQIYANVLHDRNVEQHVRREKSGYLSCWTSDQRS